MLINPGIRQCFNCKEDFIPKSHNSKFCSRPCKDNPANRVCQDCGSKISSTTIINGKRHVTANRRKCLDCLPFKQEKTIPSEEDIRRKNAEKAQRHYKKYRDTIVASVKKYRTNAKAKTLELTNGCQFCGYNKIQRSLAFHHVDEKLKQFTVSGRSFQWKLEKLLPELRKCVVACHNCHCEIHEGVIDFSVVSEKNNEFVAKLATL